MYHTVITVFVLQFLTAIAYSLFLHKIYRWYNPDYVIFTVVFGVFLSVAPAAYLARRFPHIAWPQYELWIAWGFVVSSIPMAIWQGFQTYWRHYNHKKVNGKEKG